MENWNSSYNWTKEQFNKVVKDNKRNGEEWVNLDTEHSDAQNEKNMVIWAKELGYDAEINHRNESVLVKFK